MTEQSLDDSLLWWYAWSLGTCILNGRDGWRDERWWSSYETKWRIQHVRETSLSLLSIVPWEFGFAYYPDQFHCRHANLLVWTISYLSVQWRWSFISFLLSSYSNRSTALYWYRTKYTFLTNVDCWLILLIAISCVRERVLRCERHE